MEPSSAAPFESVSPLLTDELLISSARLSSLRLTVAMLSADLPAQPSGSHFELQSAQVQVSLLLEEVLQTPNRDS